MNGRIREITEEGHKTELKNDGMIGGTVGGEGDEGGADEDENENNEEMEEDEGLGELGKRQVVKRHDPSKPTNEERREHEFTHVPFRSWCRHCVRGRGKEEACKKVEDSERQVPQVSVDYMFMGEEISGKTIALLVARERDTRATMCTVVPNKTTGEWIIRRVMSWLKEIGCEYGDLIIKSDNEPALTKMVEEWAKVRSTTGGGKTIIEHSPTRSSKSNGVVERAVQSCQGMIRTLRSALEVRLGVHLGAENRMWCWIAEYAGHLLTRFEVGKDGKTAYERMKGKKARHAGFELGESILWKRKRAGGPLGKLTCMWEDGIYLGVKATTAELIIGTKSGVWVTRTARRKLEDERWSKDSLEMVGGVPWYKNDRDEKIDGEAMKTEVKVMNKEYQEKFEDTEEHVPVPRRMAITKQNLEDHGYTVGCPGCVSILKGTARQMHTEGCRRRIEKAMKSDPRLMEATRRAGEYLERAEERREDKRKRTEEKIQDTGSSGDGQQRVHPRPPDSRVGVQSNIGQGKPEKRKAEDDLEEEAARGDAQVEDDTEMQAQDEGTKKEDEDMDEQKRLRRTIRMLKKMEKAEGEDMVDEVVKLETADTANDWDGIEKFGGDWESGNAGEDGQPELDPISLKKGREEETRYMRDTLDMFEFGSLEDAWRRGGKAPTTTRWVDGNKEGEDGKVFVRSRLVARDFKPKNDNQRHDLFAAMPPLEAKKTLFAYVAGVRGHREREGDEEIKMAFVDVKKAHLNGICEEEAWIELPKEFERWGKYARLRRWLYGMRKAASSWEEDYSKKLESAGFRRGVAASTLFHHPVSGVKLVVHGDDFTFAGVAKELDRVEKLMGEWYDIKVRGRLGSGAEEVKKIVILGRTLRWTSGGLELESDGKHRLAVLQGLGLDSSSKPVGGAAAKEEKVQEEDGEENLGVEEARKFRGLAARINYLGQDRSDLQFASKEVCSGMANPKKRHLQLLKRVARYLLSVSSVVWSFGPWEDAKTAQIDVSVDSDWAKREDRKSTSGGIMTVGGNVVKHWSRVQSSRALSVGEAEFYAAVTGGAEGLGVQGLLTDLGLESKVKIWTDSDAARGIASRRGLGKTRHVELRLLWIQEAVNKKRITISRVPGEVNPADHLTKPKNYWEFEALVGELGGYLIKTKDARLPRR